MSLYGGIAGFLAEYRNPPKEDQLILLRGNAVEHLTQAHEELSSLAGLVLYNETYSDMCVKGNHTWKRSDSYAYICSYRLTYYYGTNREYKELLLDLEKTLNDSGWEVLGRNPEQLAISEVIGEYSGEIFMVELPVYQEEVSDGTIRLTINGFDGYGVHWTQSNREPSPFGFGVGISQEIYRNESDKSPEDIFSEIISLEQDAIMITISKEYFRN